MRNVVKHSLNARFFSVEGEVNNDPSLTVPDLGYTVDQLIFRHTNGLPVNASVGDRSFDENDGTVDFGRLDNIDRAAYAAHYSKTLNDLKKKDAARLKDLEVRKKQRDELEIQVREYIAANPAKVPQVDGTNIP